MGPTWGPYGADRTQVGPILAPWTLLSGIATITKLDKIMCFPQSLLPRQNLSRQNAIYLVLSRSSHAQAGYLSIILWRSTISPSGPSHIEPYHNWFSNHIIGWVLELGFTSTYVSRNYKWVWIEQGQGNLNEKYSNTWLWIIINRSSHFATDIYHTEIY